MKIVIASNNLGKIKEFSALFKGLNIEIIPQSDYHIDSPPEIGLSFIENALIKARYAAEQSGLPAIADDSGLVVPALNGAPGIYSARYAGEEGNAAANIEKLLLALSGETARYAYFYCALALVKTPKDPTPLISTGEWHGMITEEAQGNQGFGYDPVFYVLEEKRTAAELPLAIKNHMSHRHKALQSMLKMLADHPL